MPPHNPWLAVVLALALYAIWKWTASPRSALFSFLQGMLEAARESHMQHATLENALKPATSPECAKEPPMPREQLIFEDTARFNHLLAFTVVESPVVFFDPQCDMPLDELSEKNMESMGPAAFLQNICVTFGLEVTPAPASEWECARAARKLVRTQIPSWKGERYIQ